MSTPLSVSRTVDIALLTSGTAFLMEDLDRFNPDGYFSLQGVIDPTTPGTGEIDVTYACSNDGTHFVTPTGATKIFSAFKATSGPLGDGQDIVAFAPVPCRYLKIIFTEKGVGPVKAQFMLLIS